jgi:hypothetical protein
MTNQSRDPANFHFKFVNTGETIIYNIPTNLCIANFIEFVKNQAYRDFNIDRRNRIEIVESGQLIPNVRSEDAPALRRDFNTTIRQLYNGVYDDKAFYVRIRNINNQDQ